MTTTDKKLLQPDGMEGEKATKWELDEREIYNTIHVNFLRHWHSEEGLAMMEKYLRYRAAGYSHKESENLMTKPYHKAANDMRPTTREE